MGEKMKIQIVSEKEINRKDEKLATRFAKVIAMANKLPKGKLIAISYTHKEFAEKGSETLSAFIKRHNLDLKVFKRGNTIYVKRARL